ncbi:hypothetical protein AYI68_g8195 [Smittium mucronatum]|uniref:Uncharacterized protein n=1 Tax=Smittium mucronatum TaxID=133383 RepID=A0A1R0GLL6_9FUNG|nr:hypothetical protein AYI68_g8195 [Smittium mucronatum]
MDSIPLCTDLISQIISTIDSFDCPAQILSLQILTSTLEKSSSIPTDTCYSILNKVSIFVSYDPTLNDTISISSHDNLSETDFDFEENFLDDDDDDSWKLRSTSVKLVCSIAKYLQTRDIFSPPAFNLLVSRFSEPMDTVRNIVLLEFVGLVNCIDPSKFSKNGYILTDYESSGSVFKPFISSCLTSQSRTLETMTSELLAFSCLLKLSQNNSIPFIQEYLNDLLSSVKPFAKSSYLPGLNIPILNVLNSLFLNNSVFSLDKNDTSLSDPEFHKLESSIQTCLLCLNSANIVEASLAADTLFHALNFVSESEDSSYILPKIQAPILDTIRLSTQKIPGNIHLELSKKCLALIPLTLNLLDPLIVDNESISAIHSIINSFKNPSLVLQATACIYQILSDHKFRDLLSHDDLLITISKCLLRLAGTETKNISPLCFKCLSMCAQLSHLLNDDILSNMVDLVSKSLDSFASEPECIVLLSHISEKIPPSFQLPVLKSLITSLTNSSSNLQYLSSTISQVFYKFGLTSAEYYNSAIDYMLNNSPVTNSQTPFTFGGFISSFIYGAVSRNPSNSSKILDSIYQFVEPNLTIIPDSSTTFCFSLCLTSNFISNQRFSNFKLELISFLNGREDNIIQPAIEKYSSTSRSLVSESISHSISKVFFGEPEILFETLNKTKDFYLSQKPEYFNFQEIYVRSLQIYSSAPEENMNFDPSSNTQFFINKETSQLFIDTIFFLTAELDVSDSKSIDKCNEWARVLGNLVGIFPERTIHQINELSKTLDKCNTLFDYTVTHMLRYKLDDFSSGGLLDLAKLISNNQCDSSYITDSALGLEVYSVNKFNYSHLKVSTPLESPGLTSLFVEKMFKITDKSVLISTESLLLGSAFLSSIISLDSHSPKKPKYYFDLSDDQSSIDSNSALNIELWLVELFSLAKIRTELVKIERIGPFQQITDLGAEIRKLCLTNLNLMFNIWNFQLLLMNTVIYQSETNTNNPVDDSQRNQKKFKPDEPPKPPVILIDALVDGLATQDQNIFIETCNFITLVCSSLATQNFRNSLPPNFDPLTNSKYENFYTRREQLIVQTALQILRSNSPRLQDAISAINDINSKQSDSKTVSNLLESAKQAATSAKRELLSIVTL